MRPLKSRGCRTIANDLLLTASVDEILKIDGEIRRQEIDGEIAQAKADALRSDIYWARENAKRYAGVIMPGDDELERLLAIVTPHRPLRCPASTTRHVQILDEFRRAFYSVGRLGRLPEPSADRYFVSSLDDANEILRAQRLQGIEGDTMLAAALAWGDVVWRAPDKAIGQGQEIGLARLHQGSPARPVWREILTDRADVLAPLPSRGMRSSAASYPTRPVKIYQQGADGQMHETAPIAPLLVQ